MVVCSAYKCADFERGHVDPGGRVVGVGGSEPGFHLQVMEWADSLSMDGRNCLDEHSEAAAAVLNCKYELCLSLSLRFLQVLKHFFL